MCGHPSSDTHVIFGIDVCLGFEQCDDNIGMTMPSSVNQSRPIILRTHDDTERQSVYGHPSSDTHVIFVVDVCLGFEQCDDDIGMTTISSHHQRRVIPLRTHNDTERQSKCAGITHLTRTSSLALMLALALTSAMTVSVWPQSAAHINGVQSLCEHTVILRDSPSVWASLI